MSKQTKGFEMNVNSANLTSQAFTTSFENAKFKQIDSYEEVVKLLENFIFFIDGYGIYVVQDLQKEAVMESNDPMPHSYAGIVTIDHDQIEVRCYDKKNNVDLRQNRIRLIFCEKAVSFPMDFLERFLKDNMFAKTNPNF